MATYNRNKTWNSAPNTRFGVSKSFHLTLVSVDNLRCKRLFGKEIKVHAEVQLDYRAIRKTDKYVADGPNLKLDFTVDYPITNEAGGNLVVSLYYKRKVGHRSIGEVTIDVTKLFDDWRNSDQNTETFKLPKGDLTIAYRFD